MIFDSPLGLRVAYWLDLVLVLFFQRGKNKRA